ncbi:acyl transferase domain-containing protein/NAD(P)H-dependent flavin oxidoreductase YrpB (nitropropane dioxygenase family) [Streptomyces umbrinus]|uniref:Acyl transferase domain-containing protein/NAD(P)H-dependent flavin oxidoreductase YrpB (Nitropropane dioxygenase family) n=1 Tax=Streptomyces umbrinus TaxID=67370 RepID=A0ABU0SJU4_9ACTN|nr:SDR family NAD(P)-dependent oxidoreductase [Streptomyces umbrinus]MDQ1023836.1 acyl transferase domain-containing protein/NAD(P)H-dependent flavin oxidoreductase YrpB (nitropropane dioxygenase family) [Streptomyces umbrinus]
MTSAVRAEDMIIGITPFGEPEARLAAAVSRAGGLGVLDLGVGDRRAREALASLSRWAPGPFGVRVGAHCRMAPGELGPGKLEPGEFAPGKKNGKPGKRDGGGLHTVVLGMDSPWQIDEVTAAYRVLVEVTDLEQALVAVRAGAHGLIARGSESGGRTGELSTFVLLQHLLAEPGVDLPVWACGGIGPRTAAAAVAGGAAGVVLDSQLALLAEARLPEPAAAALRSMDGSETVVVGGHRVLHRRGPDVPRIPADDPSLVSEMLGAQDPLTQLLPVGQDGFLAARFAERWGDAGRTVRALTDSVRDAVRDDGPAGALRPGSPMSRALGTRVPVAQGPMTRVSDQARFAAAVAGDGALPFIALALASGEQTRTVLEDTRAVVAGRPWGVGVLGFAPEETRNAQLEAVRELRPTHAIIAGGRPSQAEALERAGISTFLHVPSPGLLRQFLDAGARRFVFEGSECGGHVGPRASFPLWEAQLAVLEDFLDDADAQTAERVEVFFAGGVHDERSSAMIAALAAPLTARGAAVGVLMGTAYLFTDEAVECGAVRPLFQRQVMAATRTALLETAPGHATRCVPSPFSENYREFEAELRERGVPERRIWEELERLNVGRLRIASKGIERDATGELAAVAEERQLSEGMFMAGEVAVLRSATTTISALHGSVTTGAAGFLAARTALLRERLGMDTAEEPAAPEPLDVAVVGMACMFPGAPDLAAYWANILGGHDGVGEVPADRWDPAVHYSEDAKGATPSKWGGFLPRIPFDPLRYGIPPTSLGSIEPVQLLALEAARRALEDAGYGERGRGFDRSRTSVVFGAEAGSDLSNAATLRAVLPSYYGEVPGGLDGQLPRLTEDSFPGMLANVISGRIANRLDLGGANYTVDAACASSLAAVDVACKELVGGTSDVVLCGGADLHNGINDYVLFSSVHALSPTGRSRAFDSSADGIALGEGIACVVLKRLADAERDGDRIYGVIKGVGSSSDGRSLGLTAPRPEGQRAALERAYRNAGISPADVGLVEAHGTGTVVGDRTELTILSEVFTEAGAKAGGCALGSVKSQIGHSKCAAGLAGLIKTVLSLYTGVKPPTLHIKRPNPAWREESSPFAFHTRARPWAVPAGERVAGLSAFGFGGTNFHVVLSAHTAAEPPAHGLDSWPAELFTFRGTDPAAARRAIEDVLKAAGTDGRPWRLRDLALSASRRADARYEPVQVAVVATDVDGLIGRLRRALAGEDDPAGGIHLAETGRALVGGSEQVRVDVTQADMARVDAAQADMARVDVTQADMARADAAEADVARADAGQVPSGPRRPAVADGKVAFLFPGQGSQRPGMLADVFIAFPELQHYLHLGRDHADALYPPAAFDTAARDRRRAGITDTRVAQPALGIAGLAAHALLTAAGVRPDMAAGHSYGELVALCAAGAITPEALLELSAERAAAILSAVGEDPGTMAAVAAGAEDVERALRETGAPGTVVVANHNSPRQTVISGPTEAMATAVRLLRAAGHRAEGIPVACAFHSPVVAAGGERFAEALARRTVRPPEFPVWSNRTAAPYGDDADGIRAELAAQIGAPVGFVAQIEAMYEAGARVFVEAGPGSVLTRLVTQILGDRPHRTVACEPRHDSGLRGWLDALAQLAVAGLPVRTGWLFQGRDAVDATRTPEPERPGWTVDGQLVRTAAGELLPGALAPARRVVETTVTTSHVNHGDGVPADRDALIVEYLRTSREMVAAQRDVLMTYFGATAGEWIPAPVAPAAVGMRQQAVPAAELPVAQLPVLRPEEAASALATSQTRATPSVTAAVTEADVLAVVLEIISERTGYPVDMIEPDLDLEADLSIDSIKRAEIAGELAKRLSAGGGVDIAGLDDAELEDLAKARTAASVTGWLAARLAGPAEPSGGTAPSTPPVGTGQPEGPRNGTAVGQTETPELVEVAGEAPKRFQLRPVLLEQQDGDGSADPSAVLAGKRFVLLGYESEDVSREVFSRLAAHGADAVILRPEHLLTEADGRVDGVLYLGSLADSSSPVLPHAFPVFQAALRQGPRWLLAARPADGGSPGLRSEGLHGLFRTVAREYPETVARVVDLEDTTPAAVADALVAELLAPDPAPVVLRTAAGRHGLDLVETPLGTLGTTGAGPAGDGAAEAAAIGLDRDSVVLLVGGARGITATFAAALAAASRCRVELLGRTPAPTGPEDPAIAAATDRAALRTALATRAGGGLTPADINREAELVLAQREITATLAELTALGSTARYHSVDFREPDAALQAVKEIHAEHGRLDGVVYAAGVIEDRLIADKTAESFQRVYDTKTSGAETLLTALEEFPNGPAFAVLFGSISAVLGNRGQVDYAAANDALQSLGADWAARTGHRALTVHWGPWAPTGGHTGMVTPELGREYARRGIKLIDPEEGTAALLRELAWGDESAGAVVYTSSGW